MPALLKSVVSAVEKSPSELKLISAITIMNCLHMTEWQKYLDQIVVKDLLHMCFQCKLNRAILDLLCRMTSSESRS